MTTKEYLERLLEHIKFMELVEEKPNQKIYREMFSKTIYTVNYKNGKISSIYEDDDALYVA